MLFDQLYVLFNILSLHTLHVPPFQFETFDIKSIAHRLKGVSLMYKGKSTLGENKVY